MNSIISRFLFAIQNAYDLMLKDGGTRSNERIKILHGWVQDELRGYLGSDYDINGLTNKKDSREEVVEGWYYPKKVDISVKRDGKVLGVVSFKFVNSNYRQNSNNYFENQMGETANLRMNDIVFGNILCVTDPIPYKKRDGKVDQFERIRGKDIEKYSKLEKDHVHLHSPDVQALIVIRLEVSQNKVTRICTMDDFLGHLTVDQFEMLSNLNIERFFELFSDSIKAKYNFLKRSK